MHRSLLSLSLVLASLGSSALAGQIIGIGQPRNTSNAICHPWTDSVWQVQTEPGTPLPDDVGIGYLINPEFTPEPADLTMHKAHFLRPYRPAARYASVTFTFDEPTVVKLVELIQASDGVTQIEGFVGNKLHRMRSIGRVNVGALPAAGDPLVDGSLSDFSFDGNDRAGRFFRVVIRRTASAHDYALYRIFLGDGLGNTYSGNPVPAIPEPATLAVLTLSAGAMMLRRRRR